MIDGKYRTLTGPFKIDAKKDSHEYTIEPLKVLLFYLARFSNSSLDGAPRNIFKNFEYKLILSVNKIQPLAQKRAK